MNTLLLFLTFLVFNPKTFYEAGDTLELQIANHTLHLQKSRLQYTASDLKQPFNHQAKHFHGINSYGQKTAVSILPTHLIAVTFTDTGNINIIWRDDLIIFNDRRHKSDFKCEEVVGEIKDRHNEYGNKRIANDCRVVRTAIVVDHFTYTTRGGMQQTLDYVSALLNQVLLIFEADQIPVVFSHIQVFNQPDIFQVNSGSSLDVLIRFRNWYNNNKSTLPAHELCHLVSQIPRGLGGIAYTPGLCSSTGTNTGFNNIHATFNNYPIYSFSTMVIAHEIGHNLNARHTQWCGWIHPDGSKKQIDSCAAAEPEIRNGQVCYTGPLKPRLGTIMSYCHLNAGINLALGFGQLPISAILQRINTSTCLSGTQSLAIPAQPLPIQGPADACPGQIIAYHTSSTGAEVYQWTVPDDLTILSGHQSSSITIRVDGIFQTGNIQVKAINCSGESAIRFRSLRGVPSTPSQITGELWRVCKGKFTYTINPIGRADYVEWGWQGNNYTSGTQFILNNPYIQGTDTLFVSGFNGCGQSPIRFRILNGRPQQPTPIDGQSPICRGTINTYSLPDPGEYLWNVPGHSFILNGQSTNTITVQWGQGNGTISVARLNECGVSNNRTRSINAVACAPILIIPNPSGDKIRVSGAVGEFNLHDSSGNFVMKTLVEGNTEINVKHLTPGVYRYRINNSYGNILIKK